MDRFILRYAGKGAAPSDDVQRIRALGQVKIIDSSPRMLLVEAAPGVVEGMLPQLPDWHLTPEQIVRRPDPRPRIDKQA